MQVIIFQCTIFCSVLDFFWSWSKYVHSASYLSFSSWGSNTAPQSCAWDLFLKLVSSNYLSHSFIFHSYFIIMGILFIFEFVLPYKTPAWVTARKPWNTDIWEESTVSCHFLPLYFLWHDGEPMSILQCPCPLERWPQVIKGAACGPEEDGGPIGSQQDMDFKCGWELYLYLYLRFIRKERLSGNGLFTRFGKALIFWFVQLTPNPINHGINQQAAV